MEELPDPCPGSIALGFIIDGSCITIASYLPGEDISGTTDVHRKLTLRPALHGISNHSRIDQIGDNELNCGLIAEFVIFEIHGANPDSLLLTS